MNTLADWLTHLESLHPKGQGGIELGLERVARVKAALQQTQVCPVIIVGGTNGKGSTCAYLEAIYRSAGYRVGCYTSPHLLQYNERVRVDGAPVDDATLGQAFARVEAARQVAGQAVAGQPIEPIALTYFEFGTLAAWEVFAAKQVEVIILEVGLGGRLDAVNVYSPDCAVVTGIALDHMDWLGTTRESIGFEKAGIFRATTPAICADPEPPQSLLDHAAAIAADLQLIGSDFGYSANEKHWSFWGRNQVSHDALSNPALHGDCQFRNASAVLAAIEVLKERLPVPLEAIQRGLQAPDLPGRFQILPGCPAVVLDVAHNPQAVAVLAENLDAMGTVSMGSVRGIGRFEKTFAVVGMLADKDIAGALAGLAGRIDHWLLAGLEVPRGAPAEVLVRAVQAGQLGGSIESFATPAEAFKHAAKQAGENDRILVFGSFYTVAAIMRMLDR